TMRAMTIAVVGAAISLVVFTVLVVAQHLLPPDLRVDLFALFSHSPQYFEAYPVRVTIFALAWVTAAFAAAYALPEILHPNQRVVERGSTILWDCFERYKPGSVPY